MPKSLAPGGAAAPALAFAPYDEDATMGAWENFVAGHTPGSGNPACVRDMIERSWRRSRDRGVDAGGAAAPINHDREELRHLTRKNADLLAAARPSFQSLSTLLEGAGAMLVLTDAEGVMIDALGDKPTLHAGADIHLAVGGRWDECVVGTNGIGTALATGEPVFVHGAEHFCAGIKQWTCAGAPIRDPLDGKIIGVVDLSGHTKIFRPHNPVLVAALAREIEQALARQQREERTRLLETFIAHSPGYTHRDGLVIVDRRGRATFVNNMNEIPGVRTDRPFLVDCGDKILEGPLTDLMKAEGSTFPDALLSACHFNPLRLDGEIRGAALVFPLSAQGPRSARAAISTRRAEPDAAGIVGDCEALRAAVEAARRVARSSPDISLLIQGETGVGKELFARLVHAESDRAAAPFVALNCGAITRDLFGAELFGHVGGAFTGASKEGKLGVFELARGGVLSLDEIGEMPLEIQPFLLRVLEERVIRRIGDGRDRPVDIRLIASTNRDLSEEVAEGRFRSDLFYRISTVSIYVPPLRERGSDIALLIRHYCEKAAQQNGRPVIDFTDDALEALVAYRWPGNIRELRNLMSRLNLLSPSPLVRRQDLPREIRGETALRSEPAAATRETPTRPHSLEHAEREAVIEALAAERGNLSKVAQRLGISRPTLYRKLTQYGIQTQRTFS
jgi:transcriptional regulator of acetoin/glycerol metabolism